MASNDLIPGSSHFFGHVWQFFHPNKPGLKGQVVLTYLEDLGYSRWWLSKDIFGNVSRPEILREDVYLEVQDT